LRVLFLADAVFSDLPGGSQAVAREMANHLADSGHDITFLVARLNPASPIDERMSNGVRIVRYDGAGRPWDFIRNGERACASLLRETNFDIVHVHFAYAAIGPLRVLPRSIPRVRTFHGPWDQESWVETISRSRSPVGIAKGWLKSKVCWAVEAASLAQSDKVVTLSEFFAHLVSSRYGFRRLSVNIVPGGVDIDRFAPGDRCACRGRLDLPLDRRIALTVRRLTKRMGIDNLLRSLPATVARHPDLLLLIGGQGPEKEYLHGLAKELGISDHVRFLGFISEPDLPDYYRASDLFILPTIALEGFGLVTVEALASGIPVVATPAGATPELLRDLDPRLIAAGTTPSDLSDGVLAFLDGDWARALTSERLRDYALNRYTWERHTRAVEALYYDLIKPAKMLHSVA